MIVTWIYEFNDHINSIKRIGFWHCLECFYEDGKKLWDVVLFYKGTLVDSEFLATFDDS